MGGTPWRRWATCTAALGPGQVLSGARARGVRGELAVPICVVHRAVPRLLLPPSCATATCGARERGEGGELHTRLCHCPVPGVSNGPQAGGPPGLDSFGGAPPLALYMLLQSASAADPARGVPCSSLASASAAPHGALRAPCGRRPPTFCNARFVCGSTGRAGVGMACQGGNKEEEEDKEDDSEADGNNSMQTSTRRRQWPGEAPSRRAPGRGGNAHVPATRLHRPPAPQGLLTTWTCSRRGRAPASCTGAHTHTQACVRIPRRRDTWPADLLRACAAAPSAPPTACTLLTCASA